MPNQTYLDWVIKNTRTQWWHDSAEAAELALGLERGAIGVTTNPFLTNIALNKDRELWKSEIEAVLARNLPAEQKAEALMQVAVTKTCEKLMPMYEASKGQAGLVCAQVNPSRCGDRDCMEPMARRYTKWMPNISVKLPCTAAGLDVMENCIADGINITVTVSFSVPQCLAIGERHMAGIRRAEAKGIKPGMCHSVLMIGRLDDFLREVAHDSYPQVTESDIRQSGLAATKRVYKLYKERGYKAVLLVAALRGPYHMTEIVGADLLMSIAPGAQSWYIDQDHPREELIDKPVPEDVIERLSTIPEFVRAYEPDGMKPSDFMGFGSSQRTIGQFVEVGWKLIEGIR